MISTFSQFLPLSAKVKSKGMKSDKRKKSPENPFLSWNVFAIQNGYSLLFLMSNLKLQFQYYKMRIIQFYVGSIFVLFEVKKVGR
jgi:hypothetical protein